MAAPWRALPLVCAASSDTGATLQVSPDARDALLSIHAQHVGVLGVFGPPATGKRLLLNTLLQPQDVDFSAASEGNSNVLLWLWLPQGDDMKATDTVRVVLATGAAQEAENVENQRLALLLLLSSALLYNADGEIDADAVERMQWVEKVAQVLRIKGMQDEEAVASEFHEHAPKFVWLGRNFKVKWLKGSDGQRLTPREYFDQSLAPESGYGEAATKRNMLRMYLESYFPARDCVVLSRAVEGIGTEVVPPETPRSELRTQFVEAVDDMYENYLSDNAQQLPVKKLMGHELRSEQFVAVLEAYLDAINAGRLPAMQTASNTLLEQEVGEAFEVAKQTYIAEMQAVKSFEKEGGNDGERALSERKLQLAHFRGIQTAMAHLREVRSSLPERLQKTLFKDKLAELDSQMKLDFQATLERNTTLSAEICMKILERVLPRNLEDMATELAERPRDDFSDGLVRLLTQYKSDLRSALDEYMQQGSGPAVHSCLEEALLQSVRASIQKWGAMVLRQYQKHMQSWQEEKEQLDNAYEHAKVQDTETATLANNQKHSYEEQLAQATEKLSELRRVLHSELNSKKRELERLTTEITTMNLKHEVRMKNAESDLAWARSRAEELEKSIVADRQRQEGISAAAARVLEKQLNFHKEERSLLVQQKELMAQIVQLERELVQKKTKHAQKVFALQNEHAKKIDAMRMEQAKFERQLKSQAKKDLSSLKLAHEKEMKAISSENASLDKEMADIQERLAVFAAEEEAARASAAASRDFFKSMPLIQLPLMQAPAAAAGEHQPAQHSTKSLTPNSSSVPVRFGSLDDTSTSSASPLARDESPQSNDMCRQS
ncbi:Interferon-induced guanylate-binding protein 1 [Phytophthora cinnamomi]|uniref:Interferon-induced guanylate-binding protein 1 n=1 Tax=Phytophthora cinnamomi TaxID=4785 RepID=UPI003559CB51|nr:Interferon-induced guanylate-binding protein 1 [Phytophthora cinnamomi]